MVRQTLKILELAVAMMLPLVVLLLPASPYTLLLVVGLTLFLTVGTWVLYVEAMRLKRRRDNKELSLYHYPWAFVVLGIGIPFDAALNVVAGLWWREMPRWHVGEILLTSRLQRWVEDYDNPQRQQWAKDVCYLLNKHDDGHC